MNKQELRDMAGRVLYENGSETAFWEDLSEGYREKWRKRAWPLVQLCLAAGLREAAGMVRNHYANEVIPGESFYPSPQACLSASYAESIEERAKEVEGT